MHRTYPKPYDMHVHFRERELLRRLTPFIAKWCTGSVAMPNTLVPIETDEDAIAYSQAIMEAAGSPPNFRILPTIMMPRLAHDKTVNLIMGLRSAGVFAIKVYPYGTTTHSEHGIRDLSKVYPLIEAAGEADIPVLFHGELAVEGNREAAFLLEGNWTIPRDVAGVRHFRAGHRLHTYIMREEARMVA